MVTGLFANANHAAVCLSNLEEADFGPPDLSVVMKTPRDAAALAQVSGALAFLPPDQLATALIARGLDPASAAAYVQGIASGEVFIAVSAGADTDDAAKEMLADHGAREVRVVKDG
ncbi:MAG TPA: hypothetical protein VNL16_12655 [Chloroflexota bacterium]|nr:hypothetical protein [Chloroflexota bacterium]